MIERIFNLTCPTHGYVSQFSFKNKLTWHQTALKDLYNQESLLPLKSLLMNGPCEDFVAGSSFTKYSPTVAGRIWAKFVTFKITRDYICFRECTSSMNV